MAFRAFLNLLRLDFNPHTPNWGSSPSYGLPPMHICWHNRWREEWLIRNSPLAAVVFVVPLHDTKQQKAGTTTKLRKICDGFPGFRILQHLEALPNQFQPNISCNLRFFFQKPWLLAEPLKAEDLRHVVSDFARYLQNEAVEVPSVNILWMEEILSTWDVRKPLHSCINHPSTGAGFLPFTIIIYRVVSRFPLFEQKR